MESMKISRTIKRVSFVVLIFFVAGYISLIIFTEPNLDRNWAEDQNKLPTVLFNKDNTVLIKNIRNISYNTTSDYRLDYYDRLISIDDVNSAWLLIEPFGKFGAAHTFVSFGLNDGSYIAISAEIRKEKGESFSPLLGLLRQYELMYVIADESDVIKLRTNYRRDDVYLYPVHANGEKIQSVFKDMLIRAKLLSKKPEFYKTVTKNCTTNIIKHARKFSTKEIPWYDIRYLLPANIDSLAYKLGIIENNISLEKLRQKYYITKKAQKCGGAKDFSRCIRSDID